MPIMSWLDCMSAVIEDQGRRNCAKYSMSQPKPRPKEAIFHPSLLETEPVGIRLNGIQSLIRSTLITEFSEARRERPLYSMSLGRRKQALPEARSTLPEVLVA